MNRRRPSPLPCGWNHKRIFAALSIIAAIAVARAIVYLIQA